MNKVYDVVNKSNRGTLISAKNKKEALDCAMKLKCIKKKEKRFCD